VSSAQDDPDNCFNKLQLRLKMLRNHGDKDLYWFFDDDPASLSNLVRIRASSPIGCYSSSLWSSTFQLLQELVKWTGHSLRRGGASAAHAMGVSIAVIMAWGLWKSLASALLYIDVSVRPSSEALFFFGHLLTRFNLPPARLVRQATPTAVTSVIALLWDNSRRPYQQLQRQF
jgi:hypothetical protein